MQPAAVAEDRRFRLAGYAFVSGAALIIVFNLVFPRADDAWDVPAVLEMMAANQTLRQVSFLGVGVGLWALTAGLVELVRALPSPWARVGRYGTLLGAAVFTVSIGLGMAATGPAAAWVASGSDPASVDYALAAALNVADDGVWFLAIITYWASLGLLGVALLSSATFPRWLAVWILVVGFATAALVGVPLAVGVEAPALLLAFGIVGMLTAVWALLVGVRVLRSSP